MRLKSAMLVHPIRTPWNGSNLTESLAPRDGWEISVVGDMIHLTRNGEVRTIVSMAMLRWAEVAEKEEPVQLSKDWPHPDAPKNMIRGEIVVEPYQPPAEPKRRGRPPKNSV
jgi:hypothetical protein